MRTVAHSDVFDRAFSKAALRSAESLTYLNATLIKQRPQHQIKPDLTFSKLIHEIFNCIDLEMDSAAASNSLFLLVNI